MSRTTWLLAALLVVTVVTSANAATVGIRFYKDGALAIVDRAVPQGMAPAEAAVRALVAGPSQLEASLGYSSKIPSGVTIAGLAISNNAAEVDLSVDVLPELDEASLAAIFDQFRSTLGDFPNISTIKITCQGEPLASYLPASPQIGSAPRTMGVSGVGLSGKKICVGPSHGRYWNSTYGWLWQRSLTCGWGEAILEDTNSIRLVQFLKQYLTQDGATFYCPRQLDESDCCNSDTGYPWWKMCAQTWLHHAGVSSSIWASSSGCTGADTACDRNSDDIRARPLYADSVGADIYIAHHTNAGGNGTATGTEVYHDSQMDHPTWEDASTNLATAVGNGAVGAIQNMYDSSWTSHGTLVKDSAAAFGEIRIPNRPACLIELAFHDDCTRDASYLIDDFFRSVAEWGVYSGICSYFGNTPTWDKYSDEYVSDTIPTNMVVGQTYNVSITLRNRGVCWFDSRGFRLGATGDSDPFASFTRVAVSDEVKPGSTCTFNFTLTAPSTVGQYTTEWRMVRDGYAWFGATVSKAINVAAVADTQAPTVPQNLRVASATTSSVALAWDASTDNVGVLGYRVYRNGTQVGTSITTTYTDSGLGRSTAYTYEVDAYDGRPNYSAKSTSVTAPAVTAVFQDGFANLNNWTLDSNVLGNVAPTYSTAQNHGTISGAGSGYLPAGAPHWVYHDFSSSLSTGGYRTGMLSGWVYDNTVTGLRIALRAYVYDSTGLNKTMYWVGVYNSTLSTRYIAAVLNGSWTYYDLGGRTAGWHKLGIEVLPYTGSNDLNFYLDGTLALTASQPATAAGTAIRRAYLGFNSNVNQDTYWDDITLDSVAPVGPTGVAATVLSSSSIRWNFTDNANNEIGDRVYSGSTQVAEREVMDATYVDETGLSPNTLYVRTVKAYAGSLESTGASGIGTTLSAAPTTSTVTCDKAVGAWQQTNTFTFTAVGGFGSGKVHHYLVAWDQQATRTWTGSEASWSSGTSVQTATASANGWYLHVQGYNSAGVANGTLDLGPFYYDGTAPVVGSVTLTPTMAAVGDPIHAVVAAADNVGITSVTANSVALTKSGNIWVGDITALAPWGINTVTVVAKDAANNTTTSTAATYRSAQVVGATNRGGFASLYSDAYKTLFFKFWGKVTEIDDNFFRLDDGSGSPIVVHAPGYKAKVRTNDLATARGVLGAAGGFESSVQCVVKY